MKYRSSTFSLPSGLDRQFRGLRWRLLKVFSFQTLVSCLGALIASYLLLWISDRFWDTPTALRYGLWGLIIFIAFTQWVTFQRYGLMQGSSPMFMARAVQRKFRLLGSRLSGILELSNPHRRPEGYSSQLYDAAIKQVADEAAEVDFEHAVSTSGRIRLAKLVLGVIGVSIFASILFPESVPPTFKRLLVPWQDTPRFSMIEFETVPGDIKVAHGEPFSLSGEVRYHSFWKPRNLDYSIAGAFAKELKFQGNSFVLEIPGCIEPSELKLALGDSQSKVAITPVFRPALESVESVIQYPDYLGYEEQMNSVLSGRLSLLEGSRINVRAMISRDLAKAEMNAGGDLWKSVTISTNALHSGDITLDTEKIISFRWEDVFGFAGSSPWQLQVETYSDSPPTLQIRDLIPQGAYLETEIIPAVVNAIDDFGIAETGLSWTVVDDTPVGGDDEERPTPPSGKFSRKRNQHNSISVDEDFGFSPRLLGIPADSVIEVQGFARDYRPDGEPTFSEPIRVLVVSIDRHAELLRQNLENILTQAEDILRAEENISELNKMALEDLDLEAPLESVKDQIEANADLQQINARDMERLADMGQQLLREAMRNPAFKPEAIKDWNETLQQMQSISQNQMPQASQQMQNATSQQTSQEAQEDLAKAQEMIDEILEDLADLQQNINQGLDELQAMTLAQRLRALGEKQREIIMVLKKSVARTIGLTIDELSSKFVKANQYASEDQTELAESADALFQEIGRFAERTKLEPYENVSNELKEQAPVDALTDISERINANVLAQSMTRQSEWAKQFNDWASSLEPEPEEGSEGQGEGQGEQSSQEDQDNALMEMMINLLRMREKEIDIQRQTRLLNQDGVEKNEVADPAQRLSGEQLEIMGELDVMTQSNPLISLTPVLKEGVDLMQQVSTMLSEPKVGAETDLKQAETVNALTDAINIINEAANNKPPQQSQQQQQAQQATAQQMQFLMQMMSQAPMPGQMPGTQGNPNAAGETDQRPGEVAGDTSGGDPESRGVERAAGSISEMPAEYRQMLEDYFKLLEKIQK